MKRALWVLFAAGGWVLSGVFAWQLSRQRPALTEAALESQSVPVQTPTPVLPRPTFSEVYVKPHPNGFHSGRWIRFSTFSKRLDRNLEIVDFETGEGTISAPSESIDWPKQRNPQEYR